MKSLTKLPIIVVFAFILSNICSALPMLDTPYPLPGSYTGIITIYPDSDNTTQIRRYWLVPSTARIMRNNEGKLGFGLIHSGISGFDPDGINALLNVTVQPYVDTVNLSGAKKLIEEQAKQEGATSVSFNFIAPTETTCRLLVGGQYVDWNGSNNVSKVAGGSVEAGIPFQLKVTNSFDVRCLTQAGGPDAATFGALYTMKFQGVGNRVWITIDCDLEETYKHVLAHVKGSAYWGLVQADTKVEWQELKTLPHFKYVIHAGTEEQVEKFHTQKIFEDLMAQMTARTGIFARKLKPNGLPDAPGGGGLFGWGVSAGGGFEQTFEQTTIHIEIDARYTRDQELIFGMNFPTGGSELTNYVKNVTDSGKPFPTSDDFKSRTAQNKVCRDNNIASLKQALADGTLNRQLYDELIKDAFTKGCYVDYSQAVNQLKANSYLFDPQLLFQFYQKH